MSRVTVHIARKAREVGKLKFVWFFLNENIYIKSLNRHFNYEQNIYSSFTYWKMYFEATTYNSLQSFRIHW